MNFVELFSLSRRSFLPFILRSVFMLTPRGGFRLMVVAAGLGTSAPLTSGTETVGDLTASWPLQIPPTACTLTFPATQPTAANTKHSACGELTNPSATGRMMLQVGLPLGNECGLEQRSAGMARVQLHSWPSTPHPAACSPCCCSCALRPVGGRHSSVLLVHGVCVLPP